MKPTILPLHELVDYKKGQIRSRVLRKALGVELPITIFALDEGESISAEQTALTKLIQIIDGTLEIWIEEDCFFLRTGELITISPNTQHKIKAKEQCKFLQIEST